MPMGSGHASKNCYGTPLQLTSVSVSNNLVNSWLTLHSFPSLSTAIFDSVL